MTGEERYHAFKDRLRERLLKYLRKAYRALPLMDRPRILDIGCGSGVPTIELARLSGGQVIGLDIDGPLVERLNKRIKKAGFSDRVTALKCSMFELDFPAESFDIIWSEGSIFAIGFERGLREWRRLLKPGGFLVVYDEEGNKNSDEVTVECITWIEENSALLSGVIIVAIHNSSGAVG